ncbi:MAG: 3-methyl-2-oxobutanoate hydroxymethyltransferase [Planctomycetes bacterium]|nr:3-methyl-2-oxobutanoate hydroxymethyltransferase [Planctomycetota bacterium]
MSSCIPDRKSKVTAPSIRAMKGRTRITAMTAYDCPTARLVDESGMDILLVGDSLGPTVLGYPSTLPVSLEEMLAHSRAVARGASRALLVGDLPFGSYHESVEQALRSSIRFVKEGNVEAVKMEGGVERTAAIRAVVEAGIPVMGHIGLRPQAVHQMGGFRVQGKTAEQAERLLADAAAVAEAGAFSVVLEGIPTELGAEITRRIPIPTIGIGAGPDCDGQILVFTDLVGLTSGHVPKFVRRYAEAGAVIAAALAAYREDVLAGRFPSAEESYGAAPPPAAQEKQAPARKAAGSGRKAGS